MDAVAERLGMAPIRVYEVATFYFMFNMKPIGNFHLQVCGTTPCWLRGSDDVTRACKDADQFDGLGETSADGMFTMTEVECLGGCVNAPILQVNDDYYEDMDYESTGQLIEALRRGEQPRRAPSIGRQTARRWAGRHPDRRCTAARRGRSRCWRTRTASSPTSTACTTSALPARGRAAIGTAPGDHRARAATGSSRR